MISKLNTMYIHFYAQTKDELQFIIKLKEPTIKYHLTQLTWCFELSLLQAASPDDSAVWIGYC